MDNVSKIVALGRCTGCTACSGCKHITFEENTSGFPSPVIDEGCEHCGRCLTFCCNDPDRTEDEEDMIAKGVKVMRKVRERFTN